MKWFHIRPLLLYACIFFFLPPFKFALMFLPGFFFSSIIQFVSFSAFLLLSTPLVSSARLILRRSSLLCLSLSLEGEQECCVVTRKSSIWVERDEWCCLVKFNTYLDYPYRFCVVWDVVKFSLLVPLIHILWLKIPWVIFTGQNMVLNRPIGSVLDYEWLWIMAMSHFGWKLSWTILTESVWNQGELSHSVCSRKLVIYSVWLLWLISQHTHTLFLHAHTPPFPRLNRGVHGAVCKAAHFLSVHSLSCTWMRKSNGPGCIIPMVTMETNPHLLLCLERERKGEGERQERWGELLRHVWISLSSG